MISKGIKIVWGYSDEYVEFDLSNIGSLTGITSTIEWWRSEGVWVKYNTKSLLRNRGNGSFELELTYAAEANPHLDPAEYCFGKLIISIHSGKDSGCGIWIDDSGFADNGTCKWVRVSNPLVGERKRERITRIQRHQQIFRAALVALDEQCTLSGEACPDVLEAAHVISASAGGAEIVDNGILLRADLHRLLDAKLFSINESGRIVLSKKLPKTYETLLKGKSLPKRTLARVRLALLQAKLDSHE